MQKPVMPVPFRYALALLSVILLLSGLLLREHIGFGELLGLAAFVIAALTLMLQFGIVRKPANEISRQKTNRDLMIERVDTYWIKGVLDNVMNEYKAMDMDLLFAHPEIILHYPSLHDYKLPNSTSIHDVFNTLKDRGSHRRMVILGQKGSGKTVLMLQLTAKLLELTKQNEKSPFPVVFNLSSWAAERKSFEYWLKSEFRRVYGVQKLKLIEEWIGSEKLILMLDGLDEVTQQYRDECLKEIKSFTDKRKIDYVVCSRYDEYYALNTKLDIPVELVVQPLNEVQINHYLSIDDLYALREVMKNDKVLHEFARIPFLLNAMAFVCRAESQVSLLLAINEHDADARRDHILGGYVEKKLKQVSNPSYHDHAAIRYYLSWLAHKLIQFNQTVFYVEDLQPKWLKTRSQKFYYRLFFAVIPGLIFGLIIGVAFELDNMLGFEMLHGLIIGLGVGLIGLFVQFSKDLSPVQMTDEIHWNFLSILILIPIFFVFSLVLLILFRFDDKNEIKPFFDDLKPLLTKLIFAILGYTILFVIFVHIFATSFNFNIISSILLIFILLFVLPSGFTSNEIRHLRLSPGIGVRYSVFNAITVSLRIIFVFFIIILLISQTEELSRLGIIFAMTLGLIWAMISGLNNGGKAVISHLILRLLLIRTGNIPQWRYDRFLDYAANDLMILRKVGGGYMFVHDYLRQYFADLEKQIPASKG